MTTRYRTKSFVFKKDDRCESDRKFVIFTKDFGRLEVVAKAIRKIKSKLRGGIDIFYLSEIEFIQGKNYKTLTDVALIEKFDNINQDIEKLKIAYQVSEVLDNFIKGQEKDENIWNLIIETFERFDNSNLKIEKRLSIIYYYFLWNFYSLLGYQPEVQKCVACQGKLNPYAIYFSNKEGGVICGSCSKADNVSQKINSDIAKILRLILKKDWQIVSRLKIKDSSQKLLKEISDNYNSYILSIYCRNIIEA